MVETFGTAELSNGPEAMRFKISLVPDPLELSWHHCGTTSDFIGDYFSRACKSGIDQMDARHSIGYLINEILENAVKFRHGGRIEITCSLDGNSFESRICNTIDNETAKRFQTHLATLTERDPGEVLLERIEENALDESSSGSGLGLLTLMSDYDAKLGWSFSPSHASEEVSLTTFAALKLS